MALLTASAARPLLSVPFLSLLERGENDKIIRAIWGPPSWNVCKLNTREVLAPREMSAESTEAGAYHCARPAEAWQVLLPSGEWFEAGRDPGVRECQGTVIRQV